MPKNKGGWADLPQTFQAAHIALQLISLTYSVPMSELEAPTRRRAPVAFARQVAMYLVHVAMGINLSQVARMFGRDRSTVSHACRVAEDMRDDPQFDRLMEVLERTLRTLVEREQGGRAPLSESGPEPVPLRSLPLTAKQEMSQL